MIGFFEEQGLHESDLSYAQLMTILERGRRDKHIPPRPIFKNAAFKNPPSKNSSIKGIIKQHLSKLHEGAAIVSTLKKIGEIYKSEISRQFGKPSGVNIGNASRTIALKKVSKGNTPLVDTGDLKSKLKVKVTDKGK